MLLRGERAIVSVKNHATRERSFRDFAPRVSRLDPRHTHTGARDREPRQAIPINAFCDEISCRTAARQQQHQEELYRKEGRGREEDKKMTRERGKGDGQTSRRKGARAVKVYLTGQILLHSVQFYVIFRALSRRYCSVSVVVHGPRLPFGPGTTTGLTDRAVYGVGCPFVWRDDVPLDVARFARSTAQRIRYGHSIFMRNMIQRAGERGGMGCSRRREGRRRRSQLPFRSPFFRARTPFCLCACVLHTL